MALTWRQEKQFKDTCDIIRVVPAPNPDGIGTPGDDQYQVVARAVRYEHAPTPNISQQTPVGRMLKALIFTTDLAVFAISDAPKNADFIRNTTTVDDGTGTGTMVHGPEYGKCFRIQGPAQMMPTLGIRETNEASFEIKIHEHTADFPA